MGALEISEIDTVESPITGIPLQWRNLNAARVNIISQFLHMHLLRWHQAGSSRM